MNPRRLLLGGAVGLVAARALPAQGLSDYVSARQVQRETALTANIEFGAGALRIQPASDRALYRIALRYDPQHFLPVSSYDAADAQVDLGLKSSGRSGFRSREDLRQTATIELSPAVALTLNARLGAAESDLELGGLRLIRLALETGASRTTIRFSKSNPGTCEEARVTAGAAEVSLLGLGNSACRRVRFEGGVGRLLMDFRGAGSRSMDVSLKLALGNATLQLPRGTAARIRVEKFLSAFEPEGFVRSGDTWTTPGFATAARQIDVAITSAMGGVSVEWVK